MYHSETQCHLIITTSWGHQPLHKNTFFDTMCLCVPQGCVSVAGPQTLSIREAEERKRSGEQEETWVVSHFSITVQCFPQTYTLFVAAYICKFILCQQEVLLEQEKEVSPVTAVHKAALRSQTLLYHTLHARWNENDIQIFWRLSVSFRNTVM